MPDKRSRKRYSFIARATITHNNGRRVNISSTVGNISSRGLSLMSYQNIDIGSHISLELVFTAQSARKVSSRLNGTVIHVTRNSNLHMIGITLDEEITDVNHPVLSEYFRKGSIKFIIGD